jgi:N-acetylmuramidase
MGVQLLRDRFPPYIYGLHEPGGEHLMLDAGRPGWVVELARIGHDPGHVPSGDYSSLTNRGLRVIVRLNNGYGSEGTIPRRELYSAFARACASFAARCRGCNTWIIGNEPNHEVERPDGQLILPADYADAYRRCRTEIHRVGGHQGDQVLVAGPALWNATTIYPGNLKGDWVKYFTDILALIPTNECDGFSIHTYTHYHDPSRIKIDVPFARPGYHHLRDEFRSYRDLMEAIPARFRNLPVYITETDPTERNRGWGDGHNLGWVRTAYEEIAAWNSNPAHQPIQALVLYRWFRAADQPEWSICDRPGIQDDFRGALTSGPEGAYRVRLPSQPPPEPPPPIENLPDIAVPRGYTNQQLITAFYRAGQKLKLPTPWGLMAKAGIKLSSLTEARNAVYQGPEIDALPNLTVMEKRLVKWELAAIYQLPQPKGISVAKGPTLEGEDAYTSPDPEPAVPPQTGFLRIRSDLEEVPLAPPEEAEMDMAGARDSAERRVIATWNRFGWLLVTLADEMGTDPGLTLAVAAVGVGLRGFGNEGRMLIRFENHIFFERWGRHDPGRFLQHFHFNADRPWADHFWRAAVDAPWRRCHGRQGDEWAAFELARVLNEVAAKESIAMGASRILGLLHPEIGYASVDQMYLSFSADEGTQLTAFFDLIRGPTGQSRRMEALRRADFYTFAALHNGTDQATAYGAMYAGAFEAYQRLKPLG